MGEKENKEVFEVVEVPTQTGLAIKDNETGKTLDSLSLLVKIANTQEEIKKILAGA